MGLFSKIFGGSKQKSQSQNTSSSQNTNASWNESYPWLQGKFEGSVDRGLQSQDFMSRLLGLGGSEQADRAYEDYKGSAGYQSIMDGGRRAIEGSAASRGMLRSGATNKALIQFGQNTGSQFYNSYLDRLLGISQQGIASGGLIAGAGQRSYGQGKSESQGTSKGMGNSSPGIAGFIGSLLSAGKAASGGGG